MKKQFLFIAVMISAILFSCSKERIETPPVSASSENDMISNATVQHELSINTLNIDLVGEYQFDGNLKDATGKLDVAYPNFSRAKVLYTNDRKGQPNKAIYFNAKYGLDVYDVPSTPTGCSFSFWMKCDTIPTTIWLTLLNGSRGFGVQQYQNTFFGYFWNTVSNPMGQGVTTSPLNTFFWHHIVGTRDNSVMKLYIDGVLIGTSPTPAVSGPYPSLGNYNVGSYGSATYWKGSMDDLRFYKRVLSAAEVSQLYNL